MNDDELFAGLRQIVKDDRSTVAPVEALDSVTRARIAKAVLQEVAPRPRARASVLRRAAVWTTPLAMAAGLWLVFRSPDTLPGYTVEVSAQAASTRGVVEARGAVIEASGPPVRVEIVLRPATREVASVAAFAFVRRQGSWATAPGELVVAASGAARLVGDSESFRGAEELRVVLGPKLDERGARAALEKESSSVAVIVIAVR